MTTLISTNLLTLLRAGAFGAGGGSLVPMSAHKWRRLCAVAEGLGVRGYVARGAGAMRGDVAMSAVMLACDPTQREYVPPAASLVNHWTERRLEEIREEEMNAPDTSEATLLLLDMIVAVAAAFIAGRVNVEGIVGVGLFVRRHSAEILRPRLMAWLRATRLTGAADFCGSVLVDCFDFRPDELPLLARRYQGAGQQFRRAFDGRKIGRAWRMRVAPTETISRDFMRTISLVTDIEE